MPELEKKNDRIIYAIISGVEILNETPKAYLIRVKEDDRKLWIPKSQVFSFVHENSDLFAIAAWVANRDALKKEYLIEDIKALDLEALTALELTLEGRRIRNSPILERIKRQEAEERFNRENKERVEQQRQSAWQNSRKEVIAKIDTRRRFFLNNRKAILKTLERLREEIANSKIFDPDRTEEYNSTVLQLEEVDRQLEELYKEEQKLQGLKDYFSFEEKLKATEFPARALENSYIDYGTSGWKEDTISKEELQKPLSLSPREKEILDELYKSKDFSANLILPNKFKEDLEERIKAGRVTIYPNEEQEKKLVGSVRGMIQEKAKSIMNEIKEKKAQELKGKEEIENKRGLPNERGKRAINLD